MNLELNSSFSKALPSLQIAWDSTSIGNLKTCPRKYFYSQVYGISQGQAAWGWAPRAESVHLVFGLLFHGATERYDHLRADGVEFEQAVIEVIRWTLAATWDKATGRPWNSDDPNKNRFTLVRTLVWYLDQFKDDPVSTVILANGKPAVELSFRFELGFNSTATGEPFLLCGHLDRLGVLEDKTYILDKKTSKNTINSDFFKKFSPDNQFSLYTLGAKVIWPGEVKGLIVDAAQVAVTFSRFQRGLVYRDDAQLDEWLRDTRFYIKQAEYFAKSGYWPQNDKACGNYGGCEFRGICARSPVVRDQWLKADYVARQWDPLQVRGDI